MKHALPALPYPLDALAPHCSKETLEFHHGKHHAAYVAKLNELVETTDMRDSPLEEVIKGSTGVLFNNAAQVWNHTFFWSSMKPAGGGQPSGALAQAIDAKWGSHEGFKKAFQESATGNFGSGWTWLVKKPDGTVDIVNTRNADTPLTTENTALLVLDDWEHAYYIDYRNQRPKYVQAFLEYLANWTFAKKNFG